MSTDSLKRKAAALARGRASVDAYNADVGALRRKLDREKPAAIAMVAFAQHLAGTVMQPPPEAEEPREKPRRRRPSPRPAEKARQRLDMHTEATLEQVLKEEWHDGMAQDPNPGPPPRPDPGFEAWEPIIPSYARKPDDDEKS